MAAARRLGLLKKGEGARVVADTTVQEKAIAHPTDGRLYQRMRERLASLARARGIVLRQSYARKGKAALRMEGKYRHARQMKLAKRELKKLKRWLGCVWRDVARKCGEADEELRAALELGRRILEQTRTSKRKVYSVHEPEVECIAKGKAHKKYEFGRKVGLVTTLEGGWIAGVEAYEGNPYDGHTLARALAQAERVTGVTVTDAYVDKGYRGHGLVGGPTVHISGTGGRRLTRAERKRRKRRNMIEPVIGHAKSENRLDRCWLKGVAGDQINALLAGCGRNLRKLLRVFFLPFFVLSRIVVQVIRTRPGLSAASLPPLPGLRPLRLAA